MNHEKYQKLIEETLDIYKEFKYVKGSSLCLWKFYDEELDILWEMVLSYQYKDLNEEIYDMFSMTQIFILVRRLTTLKEWSSAL